MSQIELLQVGPYPSWDQERLDAHFTMHRYFEAPDKAAFLAEHGANIRGIATRGELGANRAMIEALPKLEIISVYGVVEAPGPGEVEIRLAAGGICKVAEIADASGR